MRYIIENGVRSVRPYYHEYKTPFRDRWSNKTIVQVLCGEFGQQQQAVDRAIDSGHIYVSINNGKSTGFGKLRGEEARIRQLRPHDIIHNEQHTHEPEVKTGWKSVELPELQRKFDQIRAEKTRFEEVGESTKIAGTGEIGNVESKLGELVSGTHSEPVCTQLSIPVIFQNDTLLVVNKPAGIPTHPGGIYRYNTLTEILAHELQPVWPCHRLDKSTSGVLVLAKSKEATAKVMSLLQQKDYWQKWYVARVKGHFPYESCTYTCPVFSVNSSGSGYINGAPGDRVPTDSSTEFHLLEKFADESLVLCRPISGRMHQIRIHLRNLGHPIANDNFYNGVEESSRQKNTLELELYRLLAEKWPGVVHLQKSQPKSLAPKSQALKSETPLDPETVSVSSLLTPEIQAQISELAQLKQEKTNLSEIGVCDECARPLYASNPDSGIWLHALSLCMRDSALNFSAGWPAWCENEN